MDLTLMGSAIIAGLKVLKESVRLMAGIDNNGYITTTDLAKAIASFKSKLVKKIHLSSISQGMAVIVSMAEQFIVDIQEVCNKTLTIADMQNKYYEWIIRVRKRFLILSD